MHGTDLQRIIEAAAHTNGVKKVEEDIQRIEGSTEELEWLLSTTHRTSPAYASMWVMVLKSTVSKHVEKKRGVEEWILKMLVQNALDSSGMVHKLLCDCVALVSRHVRFSDMQPWLSMFDTHNLATPLNAKILAVLNSYACKYRTEEKSNDLYRDIIQAAESSTPVLLAIAHHFRSAPDHMLDAFVGILYSLVAQDLPDEIEVHIEVYTRCIMNSSTGVSVQGIELLGYLSDRFIDAYASPEIFLAHGITAVGEMENYEEHVQTLLLRYLAAIIRNPMLETHVREGRERIVLVLVPRLNNFEDAEFPLEFTRTLFAPDTSVQRCVASEALGYLMGKSEQSLERMLYSFLGTDMEPGVLFFVAQILSPASALCRQPVLEQAVKMAEKRVQEHVAARGSIGAPHLFAALGVLGAAQNTPWRSKEKINYLFQVLMSVSSNSSPENEQRHKHAETPRQYIRYVSAWVLGAVLGSTPEHEAEKSHNISMGECMVLLDAAVHVPPNEFLMPALFQVLRVAVRGQIGRGERSVSAADQVDTICAACCAKLVKTIDCSDSAEAKGMWDIAGLGVVYGSSTCRQRMHEIVVQLISRDVPEWYPFMLQILALCVVADGTNPRYREEISAWVYSNDLWKTPGIADSLAYCLCALCRTEPEKYVSRVQEVLAWRQQAGSFAPYVLMRYLPPKVVARVLEQGQRKNEYLPFEYLGCFRACEYVSPEMLLRATESFVGGPRILDCDTDRYLDILGRLVLNPSLQSCHLALSDIHERLSQRIRAPRKLHHELCVLDEVMEGGRLERVFRGKEGDER